MVTRTYQFVRDDGTVLEVDAQISFPAGRDAGAGVEDYEAWRLADAHDANAPNVTITDNEFDRLCEQVASDPSTYEYGDDYS